VHGYQAKSAGKAIAWCRTLSEPSLAPLHLLESGF